MQGCICARADPGTQIRGRIIGAFQNMDNTYFKLYNKSCYNYSGVELFGLFAQYRRQCANYPATSETKFIL